MKRSLFLFFCFMLLASPMVVFAGGEGEVDPEAPEAERVEAEYVMDVFLHEVPEYQARDHVFKAHVEAASGGRIQVNLHARAAIAGDEHDALEMVRTGEMTVTQNAESVFAHIFPEIMAVGMPFLISNPQVAQRLLAHDSEYFQEIARGIYEGSDRQLRVVGGHTNSFRNMYAKIPIRTPDDMREANFKLRTKEDPLDMAFFSALGAQPVSVPTPDRYMALETGMVDGLEGGVASVAGIGGFDLLDYIILTNHKWGANFMVVNEDFYQSLPDDLKRVVREGWHYGIWVENPNRAYADIMAMQEVANEGVTIISLSEDELEQWRELAIPAGREFIEEIAGSEFLDYTLETVSEIEEELAREVDVVESAIQ